MNAEKAYLVICEDCDDMEFYEAVTAENITGDSRWSKFYEQVFKDTRTGDFWEISWSRGATEYQDQGVEDVEVRQVWPKVVQRTIYSPVKPE
ncbi:hypothetical protein CPT_Pasto_033 [Rhizobium phage Pasto]|uniref:Uncharacterized protein n=1 Tax=Rhizobium phage Pasto TaxID=2767575 RepID=A0A7S6TX82_9CAUD|nr:hypothetical protein CPT_Pasto_033 [Rhizobium phage Pasto]